MPEVPSDRAFLELWRAGDESAARHLFNRHVDRLVALAGRHISERLAGRVDPEDVVQSVFRTFFHRAREGQFHVEGPDDLCKLLARITVHKTLRQIAFHRRAKRNQAQEASQGTEVEAILRELSDREPPPEEVAAFLDQLSHFLEHLGGQDREILSLRMDGYSTGEIAGKLGVSDRKIRRLLERIRGLAEKEFPTT
jgi:RNA polymerase sigma-70 factor (ECF subfamily)